MSLNDDVTNPALLAPARPFLTAKADETRYAGFPHYIFGMHDSGGEEQMLGARKPGWVVIRVQVNPPDSTGDFSTLSEQGLGVIVCLNNDYGRGGTIPSSTEYEEFARQCADLVSSSQGARIWIIGNEPNNTAEQPGIEGRADAGEVITPEMYARCFNECRRAIRETPGHESDLVIPAAVAPFISDTHYPSNPSGDPVRYFADVLLQVTAQGGKVDGLALHIFTHGHEANLVTSEALAYSHSQNRHRHFRAYRDFLAAVLPAMRTLPVFITQARPLEPGWTDHNRKWIQTASAEINAWNKISSNQPIQALCLDRWHHLPGDPPGRGISDKPQVIEDWCAALQNDYRVRWHNIPLAPDYAVQWLKTIYIPDHAMRTMEVVSTHLVLKNTGAKAWVVNSPTPIRLGSLWYDAQGHEVTVQEFDLTRDVLPGQTISFDDVQVQAPKLGGTYRLKPNLMQSGKTLGLPSKDVTIYVQAPPYAVEWGEGLRIADGTMPPDSEITGTIRVRNLGSRTWLKGGPNPVRLYYRWSDSQIGEIARGGIFEMGADTPPGETAAFDEIVLRAPSVKGTFTLTWDLVEEGLTTFSAQGTETRQQLVVVKQDYAAKWLSVIEIPAVLEPNELVNGSITAQNVGVQLWNDRAQLTYEWRDAEDVLISAGQVALPHEVPPDGTVTVGNISLSAPIQQGSYILAFQFSHQGVKWDSAPFHAAVTVHTDAPKHAAQWVETPIVAKRKMITGDSLRGHVIVKNVGALTWDTSTCLGYRWSRVDGEPVSLAAPTFSLGHDLLPRDTATFQEVAVIAPDAPGEYRLDWYLSSEGVGEFSSPVDGLSIVVKPPPLPWGAEFLAHDMPPRLTAGETTTVRLRLKNNGKNNWRSGGAQRVTLGYKWRPISNPLEPEIQEHQGLLPTDVPPEDIFSDSQLSMVLIEAEIMAPRTPGTFSLEFDLLAEGVGWFAGGGNPPLGLPIRVTAAPAPTNLWRAEASHNALAAIQAIDGNLDSAWTSQLSQSPGMWFRVSLGEVRIIDGIALGSPGRGYPFGYTLRVSPDGETWNTVASAPQGNLQDVVAVFAPCEVLYVQADLLAPYEAEWAIAQVQIHPSPLWSATASLNDGIACQAIDNQLSTGWTSAPDLQVPNVWFQLDLGRVETISSIKVTPLEKEYPRGYRVDGWNEAASGWQKIAERMNNQEIIHLSFAPVQTQYLNIHLLEATDFPWTIREIQITRAMRDWVGPATP